MLAQDFPALSQGMDMRMNRLQVSDGAAFEAQKLKMDRYKIFADNMQPRPR